MGDIGFINGEFMSLGEARVPVEDRGFQFGDGVYEVIRTYEGRPFQIQAHLSRLERSASAVEIQIPYTRAEWMAFVQRGIELGGYSESKIYIQLTRGVAPRDHSFPSHSIPTAVITVRSMTVMDPLLQVAGVQSVTIPDLRWGRCDIKTINLLPNVLARQRAKAAGAFEAILFRGENVTEGSVSNVMAVKGGVLITPPSDERILAGITRSVVLGLARKDGIPVEERILTCKELERADEVFLTGTTIEVMPVVAIDAIKVGHGKPGPIAVHLIDSFRGECH
jgi:D-alanine transaminase